MSKPSLLKPCFVVLAFVLPALTGCDSSPPKPAPLNAEAMEAIEREDARIADEESGL